MINANAPVPFLTDDLPLWSAPLGLKLLEVVKFRKNATILDIGSGFGFPALELAMRFGEKTLVYGIDPWMEGVAMAKAKAEKMGLTNVRFLKQPAENPDFQDDFFDIIVANNSLNNVQNPYKALQQCYKISKNGSQLVLTMNTQDTMPEFYAVFKNVLREKGLVNAIDQLESHVIGKRMPVDDIKNLILSAGFKINQSLEDKFNLRYLDGTSLLNHFWIRFAFLSSWQSVVSQSDMKSVFDKLEKELNVLADKKGELSLTIPFVTFDCEK